MLSMVGPCIPNVAVVTGMKGEGPRERTARNWKPEGEDKRKTWAEHLDLGILAITRVDFFWLLQKFAFLHASFFPLQVRLEVAALLVGLALHLLPVGSWRSIQ